MVKSDGDILRCNGIAHVIDDDITVLELEPLALECYLGESLENYFQLVQNSQRLSSKLSDVEEIASLMAGKVKAFTGFDRVMIYRFSEDYSGEVIGEAREEEMESFLHLRYPATDIPEQARALYLKNWVRLLRDAEAEVSPLVPVVHPQLNASTPLDKSVLRSISPIHLQYLRNMGVRSTLTISLIDNGKLWGLIACHHRTPRFVSYGVRATSSLYGVVMSAQLSRAEQATTKAEQTSREQAIARFLKNLDPLETLEQSFSKSLPFLLKIFDAHGAAFIGREKSLTNGSSPPISKLRVLTEKLVKTNADHIVITDTAHSDYPDLADLTPTAAGFIAIPLGHRSWLMIFRNERKMSIRWGGNPHQEKKHDDLGRLTPR